MISVKLAIALSMAGIGASTFGVGAYVSSHTSKPVEPPQSEVDVARLPVPDGFGFARATSMEAQRPTESKVLMLEPVLIYGRNSARRGPSTNTDGE